MCYVTTLLMFYNILTVDTSSHDFPGALKHSITQVFREPFTPLYNLKDWSLLSTAGKHIQEKWDENVVSEETFGIVVQPLLQVYPHIWVTFTHTTWSKLCLGFVLNSKPDQIIICRRDERIWNWTVSQSHAEFDVWQFRIQWGLARER